MQLTFKPVRLTGFAILSIATATTLSLGACSKSHDEKSSDKSSAPAAAKAKDSVHGLVASVSGNTVQVNQESGTATVNVSSSTKITEFTKAQLSDVAAGSCVNVVAKPAPPTGGPVTATSVQLTPQGAGGKCPQPKTAAGAPGQPQRVVGTVTSVADNVIHVTAVDANGNPAPTDVTVTDKTQYTRHGSAASEAIAQGKCITAHGNKDGGGSLQATVVTLGPAHDGKCPPAAAK